MIPALLALAGFLILLYGVLVLIAVVTSSVSWILLVIVGIVLLVISGAVGNGTWRTRL